MSAFLGPIHHWLFNKIKQQQSIVSQLCELGDTYELKLSQECDSRYGIFPDRPLEEIIDSSNIHGWLQEHVSSVEYKYAYCVLSLLAYESSHSENNSLGIYDKLKCILKTNGTTTASPYKDSALTAPQVYQLITDNLLDGMPCDHANQIVSQSPEELTWKRNLCVHEAYWTSLDGDISLYYELRDSWLEGFLETLSYSLEKVDALTYKIKGTL